MKKIVVVLLLLALILPSITSCSSNNNETGANKNNFGPGDKAIIKDDKGNEMYSFTVDGVKEADDFEYMEDFSEHTNQVIEVDYTYENINKDDMDLYIHGADLQVIDQEGKAAESSSMFPKQQPQEAGVGVAVRVQAYYGLENESEEVQIILKSESYDTTITIKVPVN